MFKGSDIIFDKRGTAGLKLADEIEWKLSKDEKDDVLVLGVPRGGIPVAVPIAKRLDGDLDVLVVKKLGAPANPELAIGAVGEQGNSYLNEDVVSMLSVDQEYLIRETRRKHGETKKLASEIRDVKPKAEIEGRSVILVDDGIATGATIRACLEIVGKRFPEALILAVPVAPAEILEGFESDKMADRIVCLEPIEGFFGGISGYFNDFSQVSSEEVQFILKRFDRLNT